MIHGWFGFAKDYFEFPQEKMNRGKILSEPKLLQQKRHTHTQNNNNKKTFSLCNNKTSNPLVITLSAFFNNCIITYFFL